MTEPATTTERRDLPRLTSLRWFAAVAVYLLHLGYAIEWRPMKLFVTGGAGVMFFFVLSGFVLTWSMKPGLSAGRFYLNRLARIAPSATVTTIAAGVVSLVVAAPLIETGPLPLVANLTFVQAWFSTDHIVYSYNGVAWTLSVEAAFYLCFPLLVPILRRMALRAQLGLAAGLIGASAVAQILLHRADLFAVGYANPLIHLPVFVVGIIVALRVRAGWTPPLAMGGATLVLVVLAVVSNRLRDLPVWQLILLPSFVLLLASAATADLHHARGWLTQRWLVYLGEVSFCFYLTHWLVLKVVLSEAGWGRQWSIFGGLLPAAGTFVPALIAAIALHHLVELPGRRRITGWANARQAEPRKMGATTTHVGTEEH